MDGRFDVIIVGARCAGATLATYLARIGARVLLLDKDQRSTDHVVSTHWISPTGMDVLDEVGVGAAVRSVTPPSRFVRLNPEGATIDLELRADRASYCPRRQRLDGLLQHRAESAGARFHDRARVTGLVHEGGRVCGVRALVGGRERTFAAPLVVGADGRHSSVAKWVGAEEYLDYDAPRATWWAYWRAPQAWRNDPAFGFDAYFGFVADEIHAIFQTDHDRLLIASSPRAARIEVWRADPARALAMSLASNPAIAPLVAGRSPDGPVRGAVAERFFFRTGAGPGWALAGDAGHHKEFLLGDGITEALLQARSLAATVASGTDAALVRWWRARDVEALPIHWLGRISGVSPSSPLQRELFARLAHEPSFRARLEVVMEERRSPLESLAAHELVAWTVAAAWRGGWRALAETIELGRGAVELTRELEARRALLAAAEAADERREAA